MKKITLLLLVCAMLLTACAGGDVSEVGRQICPSDRYSEREIAAVMDVVEHHFRKHMDGCKLIHLEYDEEKTRDKAARETEQNGQETIILLSSFQVDESGGDGSLNPGQTYKNYEWSLVKTFFGWELKDSGYA